MKNIMKSAATTSSRLLLIVLALALLTACGKYEDASGVPTSAETPEPPAEPITGKTDGITEPTYTETANPRYGYTFELGYYNGKVLFLDGDADENLIVSIYHMETVRETEYPGWMFDISRYTLAEFENLVPSILSNGGYWPFAADENYFYVLLIPTDVQSEYEEYALLCEAVNPVLDYFKKENGLPSYNFWVSPYAGPDGVQLRFSDDEIADARAIVEAYFAAKNAHDDEACRRLWTSPHSEMETNKNAKFTDIEISLETDGGMRDSYLKYGGGAYNGTRPDNCIVFRCGFTVSGDNIGAWDAGRYGGWSIILVRQSADAPWLIDGEGY